ncbi:sensor histidine kinase [Salegentibacter chungangensis]|uniref:histidine kinase n=1 Tax=Salegentibacter chungangensis TaxID=1335724 RepID=A0ABW3NQJ2_9FLAO
MIAPNDDLYEKARVKSLESYNILDTLPEKDYDNLTAIAAEICGTPIALISLLDHTRQWFKSHQGIAISETPKEHSFCRYAIEDPDNIMIIPDARKDRRLINNTLVNGNPEMIFYAGVPLKNEDGFPLGTLCVIDDKPNELNKNQIKSLQALAEQAINLLELRRKRIELENAFKEVERKNRELEKFAFVAAHDISSPLNNIASLAEIILSDTDGKLDIQEKQVLEMIKGSAGNLRELVNGLLQYTQSEKLLKENLVEIKIETLKKDLESHFYSNKDCHIILNTKLEKILVNRTAIEQILINLLTNSVKYNDKDFTEIEIGISENEDELEFYVQDNGPGIPEKDQESIFNIFEIVTAKDRFGNKGTGIGLATVKNLIKTLGGEIRVESKPGDGARFIFNIKPISTAHKSKQKPVLT